MEETEKLICPNKEGRGKEPPRPLAFALGLILNMSPSNRKVISLLRSSGFEFPRWVEGCASITELLPEANTSGIYVLHLNDGFRYVGKSREIARRFSQHSANFVDIKALSFRHVAQDKLDEVERDTVSLLEDAGVKLRNILLSSFTHAESSFSELMPLPLQEKWLSDTKFVDIDGQRTMDEALQARYESRFKNLCQMPNAEQVIHFLHCYLPAAIPAILRTEAKYWAISCLPPAKLKVFCRVNIYWQEVLTVFEDAGDLLFSFHLAKSGLSNNFLKTVGPIADVTNHRYAPGGSDQINIVMQGGKEAIAFLKHGEVLSAVRKFNLNLMRKGLCQYARYHCYQLASNALET